MASDANTDLPPLQAQAIEWLIRLRTLELTDTDTQAFAEWLSADVEHAQAFANAEDLFETMSQAVHLNNAQPTTPAMPLPKPARSHQLKPKRWLAVPLALGLCALLLVLPKPANMWAAMLSDFHTDIGEQRTMQLADGSKLLLNTDTAVSVDYQNTRRHITLHQGQAQFIVASDPARPFTVSAGTLNVRALGTVFEVYLKASGDIDLAVQEHAVSTQIQAHNMPPVLVQQGQQLSYSNGTLKTPTHADEQLTGAWQQRRLVFRDRPLAELVTEIERYRPGRIFLAGSNLGKLRVTGLFSLADTDALLGKITAILGLKATHLGPWCVLLHR